MTLLNLTLIDMTFLGKAPNRERTFFQLGQWVQHEGVKIRVVTTRRGRDYYRERLAPEVSGSLEFFIGPLSRDFDDIHLLRIPWEYIKRIIGALGLSISVDNHVLYTISPLIVDVGVASLIKWKKPSTKVIVNYDNFVPPPRERPGSNYFYKLIPYLAHKITLFLMRFVDGMPSYMSPARVRDLADIFKNKKPTLPLTNGLDLEFINGIPEPSRKEYDIAYLGRIHPAKGVWDLLRLTVEIKKARPKISVCLIGPVERQLKEELDAFIQENGLADNVVFSGFVDTATKYTLLKKSKIFIFFSYDDSSPVSVIEAIACRLPLVLYDLEVYDFAPFKESYHKIFQKGRYRDVLPYVLGILDNEDKGLGDVRRFYENKSIVISSTENAEKELNFFREALRD